MLTKKTRKRRSFWLRSLLALSGLALVAAWGGYEWLVATAQTRIKEGLAERGLTLTYKSQSWSPWGGLTLEQAALCRLNAPEDRLIGISSVHVDLLWREAWRGRVAVTRWRTKDATLFMKDRTGEVSLQHFTTDFVLRDGQMDLSRLETRNGALAFNLSGQLLMSTREEPAEGNFELNLDPLRAVLNALNVEPDAGLFTVGGDFLMDLRETPAKWRNRLRGTGQNVMWRGIPMREADINAEISDGGLKCGGEVKFASGSANINLQRDGWDVAPLVLSGILADSAGRKSEFAGAQDGKTDTLTIARLSGNADLFELAGNVPALRSGMPQAVKVKTFPDIAAKNFVWLPGKSAATWSLSSLQIRTPAAIAVDVRGEVVDIDQLLGQVSFQRNVWSFSDVKGRLLGGRFNLDGAYDGRTLSEARVSLQELRLARLTPWTGSVKSSLENSVLSLNYRGAICDDPTRSNGNGSVILAKAPVVQIPLLDQTYALFPSLLPENGAAGTGDLSLSFDMSKGVAKIRDFKAQSESLTVTASGMVDLNKRQIDGKARANLRGVIGVVTNPFSHVITEMKISGPLDDIRVSPLGPVAAAKSIIKGTTGTAKGSVKMSGTVVKEGLSLPFEALGLFRGGKRDSKSRERGAE